jgi:hypothetical protein
LHFLIRLFLPLGPAFAFAFAFAFALSFTGEATLLAPIVLVRSPITREESPR